ncbi:sigma-54-dependent Fis family transcriptional regulator [Acidihalobacter yilgarnensis]|uniref:Sigma-54-dependent Fis family transcriptional regulator n=1 Tax=Acidihalobacter yilgarnensis TaxID=2819280 RepID=A0A1D8IRF8_9GAMM|nr:sigma-54 dependent transcriptional regulator [Acidihalobacter yilgarnensis]AOU98983.1 sigma-54-dependent Fis family transcriptional regulator [Acidihalobacter yilgarnensis]
MSTQHVLIVDDEPDIRELLEITLGRMGLETHAAGDLREAGNLLRDARFDLCLTDLRLPDGSGIQLVDYIQQHHPELPVAVISAHGTMETAIAALKAGAFDFVAKPVDLERLRALVGSALKLNQENSPQQPDRRRQPLLGNSPAMQGIRDTVAKLARSQAPIYIHGESGTGKELIARQIHDQGPRRTAPFVPVNCGAIPPELMESEFFGHIKGSFTGATVDRPGLFQTAHGGTLFLDEVADLPLAMQVKLLRAIQERRIRPVGANQETPVDVRILSATHKNLADEVAANRFRQDLYFRLNVIELQAPPLRERIEDLPLLATHLLERIASRWGHPSLRLADGALHALEQYPFPGNVRELENILERAATLCEGQTLYARDLRLSPPNPAGNASTTSPPPLAVGEAALDTQLANQQREVIRRALEQTRWNKTQAAEVLGISFRQLRYRLKKLGIE